MTHASLFSGIGGPEIAAAMLGWDNLFHCEINPFGRKVLDYWFPNSKSYEDITKTDFSEWRSRVDVLTGGFPCQPFSYAGKRRGADDDRYLWPYMFKAIDAIRPAWVVAENVAGITTMVERGEVVEVGGQASLFEEVDDIHRYRLVETFTLQRICDDLESHGYAVQPVLIPACAVGAPHRRDRVFIIANSDECDGLRAPGEDAGESGKERVQKRDEVRIVGESDKVRPKMCNFIADTTSEQSGRLQPGQPGYCKPQQVKSGGRCGEDDAERNAEDTMHGGFVHGQHEVEGHQRNEWDIGAGGSERIRGIASRFEAAEAIAGNGRWEHFPSVSPVHRGNDGLPFDVDRLSVPFSKWRTESLKAYGNAIVPQVMYEIFRAIELVSNQ